ncbi:helix-turn-helix domain-containing protein [Acidovorax cavernicola]|uniref:helix-turn-helix domain-containing protein n=1 Tax=Acidovorax cavernicola TaxID=1675792 RepID=UPI00197AA2E8|nr:helix-turn-helix domain-containing protein [Acidovorax cavernicola]
MITMTTGTLGTGMTLFAVNPAKQAGRRGPYVAYPDQSAIRRMRVKQGMTQPECAKHCGVSLRTFQRAEAGDVVPTHVKRKIERALGAAW